MIEELLGDIWGLILIGFSALVLVYVFALLYKAVMNFFD